ncbi:Uncharacterised protein [Vibrio cholerae]|nr:Uncharacterised protein [Vibrio cholerae]
MAHRCWHTLWQLRGALHLARFSLHAGCRSARQA